MVAHPSVMKKIPSPLVKETDMGQVIVKARIVNYDDMRDAARGRLRLDEVRQVEVEGLVDTGATFLALPDDIVRELGLPIDRMAPAVLADGQTIEIPVATGVYVEIMNRHALVECLVLKAGTRALIGQIPLEAMDWQVDLKARGLKPGLGTMETPKFELLSQRSSCDERAASNTVSRKQTGAG